MMTPVGAPTRMGRDVPSRSPVATPGQPGPCGGGVGAATAWWGEA